MLPLLSQQRPELKRLLKDLVLLSRSPQLASHFETYFINPLNLPIIVELRYFYYHKDGRVLDKAFHTRLTLLVPQNYPFVPPSLSIKTKDHEINRNLVNQVNMSMQEHCHTYWSCTHTLRDLLVVFMEKYQKYPLTLLIPSPFTVTINNNKNQMEDLVSTRGTLGNTKQQQKQVPRVVRKRRQVMKRKQGILHNSTTETKNLNRHFRSKLREVLRDQLKKFPDDPQRISLYEYFKPNRVGFKEIRYALKQEWFCKILKGHMKSGEFLRRIEASVMNIQSKLLMVKYYPIMERAINDPSNFDRWKY